jgi:RNA polymerase sigma factor (sigma-70 family)
LHEIITRKAFDACWTPLRPALTRAAERLVGINDAEDVASDVYAIAVTILERYVPATGQPGLFWWLLGILDNVALQHNRMTLERVEDLLAPDELIREIDALAPLDDGCAQGVADTLDKILDAILITKRQRDVWRYYQEGYSQRAIGEAVGISQPTVSYHLARIHGKLRSSAGDLIGSSDGYASTTAMWHDVCRVTRYYRPLRRGAFLGNKKLGRLR